MPSSQADLPSPESILPAVHQHEHTGGEEGKGAAKNTLLLVPFTVQGAGTGWQPQPQPPPQVAEQLPQPPVQLLQRMSLHGQKKVRAFVYERL